jgi:mRNA interferase YafQ
MNQVKESKQYTKDKERISRTQVGAKIIYELIEVLGHIISPEPIPEKYKDHELIGNWKSYRELHIRGDLLLIYRINGEVLELVRLGSHSDLFG